MNVVLKRYHISNKEIAKLIFVHELTIQFVKEGRVFLKTADRINILNYLKHEYDIDISKGIELIDCLIVPERAELAKWISDRMSENRIQNKELSEYLKVSTAWMSYIKNGKVKLSKEQAEKIFEFFEKSNIDTSEGRKKYQEFYEACLV